MSYRLVFVWTKLDGKRVRWVRLTEPVVSGRLIDGRKFRLARIGGRRRTSRMIDENVN